VRHTHTHIHTVVKGGVRFRGSGVFFFFGVLLGLGRRKGGRGEEEEKGEEEERKQCERGVPGAERGERDILFMGVFFFLI
jgi:hypothetical protein